MPRLKISRRLARLIAKLARTTGMSFDDAANYLFRLGLGLDRVDPIVVIDGHCRLIAYTGKKPK
jgi:hypothetical protein